MITDNITIYWQNEAKETTRTHVLAYRLNQDGDYFATNLYQPFLSLVNYIYVKVMFPQSGSLINYDTDKEYYINGALLDVLKAINGYKEDKDIFSYFGVVAKNYFVNQMKRHFFGNRDARKVVYLDGMEQHEKDALEQEYKDSDVTAINDLKIELNHFLKTVKFNQTESMVNCHNLITKAVNEGKELPNTKQFCAAKRIFKNKYKDWEANNELFK